MVTGANKGIGLEVCRQLAADGVAVVVTSRDEKRGLEALHHLKTSSGFSDELVFFHQLDVTDSKSIESFVDFVRTRFRKLDILVIKTLVTRISLLIYLSYGSTFKQPFTRVRRCR